MGSDFIIREKCLLVKEKWPFVVDSSVRLWYRFRGYVEPRARSVIPLVDRVRAAFRLAVVLGSD
jgi:hypothetical protein